MFDKYITGINPSYERFKKIEANVVVNEHRAPTDDSIKIFNEMVEKAKHEIVKTIPLQSTFIDAVIIAFVENTPAATTTVMVCFKLNGELIKLEHREVSKKRMMETWIKEGGESAKLLLMKEAISMISEYIAMRMMEIHLKGVFGMR